MDWRIDVERFRWPILGATVTLGLLAGRVAARARTCERPETRPQAEGVIVAGDEAHRAVRASGALGDGVDRRAGPREAGDGRPAHDRRP